MKIIKKCNNNKKFKMCLHFGLIGGVNCSPSPELPTFFNNNNNNNNNDNKTTPVNYKTACSQIKYNDKK